MKVECGDCDWEGNEADLQPVQHLEQRIDAGSEVPAGECPKCGALAWVHESDNPFAQSDLKIHQCLKRFIENIEAVGGLVVLDNGQFALVTDEDWIDLADTYHAACQAIGKEPVFGAANVQ